MQIVVKKVDTENGVWSWEIRGKTKLPYKDGTGDFDSLKKLLRNAGFEKGGENPDARGALEHCLVKEKKKAPQTAELFCMPFRLLRTNHKAFVHFVKLRKHGSRTDCFSLDGIVSVSALDAEVF